MSDKATEKPGGNAITSRILGTMEARGLSRRQLAKSLGYPAQTIATRLDQLGDSAWRLTDGVALSMVLGVDLLYLLCRTHEPQGPDTARLQFLQMATELETQGKALLEAATRMRRLAGASILPDVLAPEGEGEDEESGGEASAEHEPDQQVSGAT